MVVGGSGFVTNYLALTIFYKLINLPILPAQIISAELAVLVTFMGNNYWTFTDHHHIAIHKKLIKYHLSALGGIILNSALVVLLVRYAHLYYGLALVIGSIVALIWNYNLYNRFVFKKHKIPNP